MKKSLGSRLNGFLYDLFLFFAHFDFYFLNHFWFVINFWLSCSFCCFWPLYCTFFLFIFLNCLFITLLDYLCICFDIFSSSLFLKLWKCFLVGLLIFFIYYNVFLYQDTWCYFSLQADRLFRYFTVNIAWNS